MSPLDHVESPRGGPSAWSASVRAILIPRLQLMSLDVEDVLSRLLNGIALALSLAVLVLMLFVAGFCSLLFAFGVQHGLLISLICLCILILIAGLVVSKLRDSFADEHKPMAATIAEIDRDLSTLKQWL
jgi:uncharacterized membrane protein YqjE